MVSMNVLREFAEIPVQTEEQREQLETYPLRYTEVFS